jgi:hypothetical protein
MQESTQFLISEALKNALPDVDVSSFIGNFIMVDVTVFVGDGEESINATLYACRFTDDKTELEIRALFEDAIGLSEVWSSLIVKEFNIRLKEEKINHEGPFRISSFGMKDFSPEQRTCVIVLHLRKD